MLRRFWRAETGIFLAIWLVLMLAGRSSLLRDPGTFWHTIVGQKMLDSGEIVRTDPFSFTRYGEPWTAHQWLAECGMAAADRLAGWDGLLLLTATLLAGIYTWVAWRMLRAGFHVLWVAGVLALVLLASSHQFHVRPLVLTIALIGWTFALLVDVEAGRKRLRQLWWFVPLAALWANLHAGAAAGIGTVGLCVAGWCLLWLMGKDSPVRRLSDAIALAALVLTSGLAVLLNPYGLGLPRAWLKTLTIPLPGLIQEHARLDPADPLAWATVLLGIGYLVALAGIFPRRPRVTWLMPLLWFVLASQRVRNVPLFAITAAIATAEVLPRTRWAEWLVRREVLLPDRENEPRRFDWPVAALPLVLVVAAMLLQSAGISAPLLGRGWAKHDEAVWPVELLPQLEQINLTAPENTRIFNDMSFGGFVIYHAPRLKVFIDDRCALYGTEFLQAYDHARRKDPAQIDRWQQQYGFRYALVKTGTNFDRYLNDSAAWKIIQRTPTATLYRLSACDERAEK